MPWVWVWINATVASNDQLGWASSLPAAICKCQR
jgi:hypothetical protein